MNISMQKFIYNNFITIFSSPFFPFTGWTKSFIKEFLDIPLNTRGTQKIVFLLINFVSKGKCISIPVQKKKTKRKQFLFGSGMNGRFMLQLNVLMKSCESVYAAKWYLNSDWWKVTEQWLSTEYTKCEGCRTSSQLSEWKSKFNSQLSLKNRIESSRRRIHKALRGE